MAYDLLLEERIQVILAGKPGLQVKKMFGGVGFLLHGNMACGVHKDELIVRVGPQNYQQALRESHTHEFDMTGRPMSGWVMVSAPGFTSAADLSAWVQRGVDFALSLPPKQ